MTTGIDLALDDVIQADLKSRRGGKGAGAKGPGPKESKAKGKGAATAKGRGRQAAGPAKVTVRVWGGGMRARLAKGREKKAAPKGAAAPKPAAGKENSADKLNMTLAEVIDTEHSGKKKGGGAKDAKGPTGVLLQRAAPRGKGAGKGKKVLSKVKTKAVRSLRVPIVAWKKGGSGKPQRTRVIRVVTADAGKKKSSGSYSASKQWDSSAGRGSAWGGKAKGGGNNSASDSAWNSKWSEKRDDKWGDKWNSKWSGQGGNKAWDNSQKWSDKKSWNSKEDSWRNEKQQSWAQSSGRRANWPSPNDWKDEERPQRRDAWRQSWQQADISKWLKSSAPSKWHEDSGREPPMRSSWREEVVEIEEDEPYERQSGHSRSAWSSRVGDDRDVTPPRRPVQRQPVRAAARPTVRGTAGAALALLDRGRDRDRDARTPPQRGRARARGGADPPPRALEIASRGQKRARPADEPAPRALKRVRVSNIPKDLDPRDIKDAFESETGKIMSCITERGGVAWLSYTSEKAAQKAVETFNRGELNGNIIKVELVHD
mmetsp:Transcript_11299/g.25971  ORF Transcript_11299/g.25971 Transcript_11299/m.25971 type:complete len:542 (+) Transcript_11299:67-1692(+)